VNVYGELANGVKVVNCNIHDNGKVGDALSVGAGIVVTRGCSDITLANNVIKNNKQSGIFISSAGLQGAYYMVANNSCHQNGECGIKFVEQSNYGSVPGVGLDAITITGNVCSGNTVHGILVGTYDNVGLLTQIAISGNVCTGNTQYGIIAQSNAFPNNIRSLTIAGNTTESNVLGGVVVDPDTNPQSVSGNINNNIGYYESKSWTPVVQGTVSAGAGTYTAQQGKYTKIGDIVFYDFNISWSAHTGTGNTEIIGLPILADPTEPQNLGQADVSMPQSLPVIGQYFLFFEDSTNKLLLRDASSYTGAGGSPSPVPLNGAASYIRGNGWYRVAN
jgi:parallel beta-helix repeat protein